MRTTVEPAAPPIDMVALERALRERTDAEVHFDLGTRALYATDGSNYRQLPLGVVIPRTVDAIDTILAVCRDFDAPVLARGGGTSLAGQTCNVAVLIDTSKYLRKILRIDTERRLAVVEPGVVLDQLREETKKVGLTFAPDPSTHTHNTLGGMIGNNSCGVHSLMAGRTSDNVAELEVVTYDGQRMTVGPTDAAEFERVLAQGGRKAEIYRRLKELATDYAEEIRARFPDIPRRVSGYNLIDLLPENGFQIARSLVGSEGTCVLLRHATLRLVPHPPKRALVLLGYPDIFEAADAVPRLLEYRPIGLEAMDYHLVENMEAFRVHVDQIEKLPEGKGWLLVEFGADTEDEARGQAERMLASLEEQGFERPSKIVTDPEEQHQIWLVRESGLAVTAREPEGKSGWPGWEDSAVHPNVFGQYLRAFQKLLERYGLTASLYGHFGQGCLHCRITFDLESPRGVEVFHRFLKDAADLVVSLGGSLSGEHGDGQARGEFLERMYGPRVMDAFREFKRIWDPRGRMNPGKKVDAAGAIEHLRLVETYRPRPQPVEFSYPDDGDDFNRVSIRCVGIGECRKVEKGVMCPSYMATLEEKYSTRGRARLLYEMAQNGAVPEGWRSDYVRDALDYCLSCKGCRKECPVKVDMATYKAEFLSHYYAGRLRPRHAYALGLSYRWLPVGATMPGFINRLAKWPPTGNLMKSLGGIAKPRPMPPIARQSYRSGYRRRAPPRPPVAEATVMLWTDTWNNYLHPNILRSAEEVLRRTGHAVRIPRRRICCGRPLYDFGMLGRARRLLARIVESLAEEIQWGIPVVVLEPSCLSVFKDELPALLRGDPRAMRLSQTAVSLPDFLEHRHIGFPTFRQKLLIQPHCHESSVIGTDSMKRLFQGMGAEPELLDAGCCGMAGSFGMEAEKYPVSVKIAERKLLPAVEKKPDDAILVADGFSCREQLRDLGKKDALHVAQVLELALQRAAA